ncbi:hypothetical protein GGX14DRAFT_611312 [Mycena pura]|uniref:Uncharacterized protein n=1 Tax=Mycena pura TaxID=153505 RepID=A0AAD6UMX2_9AGAR|nr:hypothetical protein GGX14DRAFT_611312 [Mycena pura]
MSTLGLGKSPKNVSQTRGKNGRRRRRKRASRQATTTSDDNEWFVLPEFCDGGVCAGSFAVTVGELGGTGAGVPGGTGNRWQAAGSAGSGRDRGRVGSAGQALALAGRGGGGWRATGGEQLEGESCTQGATSLNCTEHGGASAPANGSRHVILMDAVAKASVEAPPDGHPSASESCAGGACSVRWLAAIGQPEHVAGAAGRGCVRWAPMPTRVVGGERREAIATRMARGKRRKAMPTRMARGGIGLVKTTGDGRRLLQDTGAGSGRRALHKACVFYVVPVLWTSRGRWLSMMQKKFLEVLGKIKCFQRNKIKTTPWLRKITHEQMWADAGRFLPAASDQSRPGHARAELILTGLQRHGKLQHFYSGAEFEPP